MAIVRVMEIGGAVVRIDDDGYRDCEPEELERRKKAIRRMIGKVDLAIQRRERRDEARTAEE